MAAVLLLEPDTILARSFSQALQAAGHAVTWCRTANQAIIAADDQPPDLLVIEPQLARHNGLEFLYEFRSYPEWDSVPAIIHSQLPEADLGLDARQRRDLGIGVYLQKSRTSLEKLVRMVNGALGAGRPGQS